MRQPPRLQLVPPGAILKHEDISASHLSGLRYSLTAVRTLKDPLQVISVGNRYLLVDGHHRFRTLVDLGAKWIPVQISGLNDVRMSHWYHNFSWSRTDEPFWRKILEQYLRSEANVRRLGIVKLLTGDIRTLYAPAPMDVAIYRLSKLYRMETVNRTEDPPHIAPWICYDGLNMGDILDCAQAGRVLPSGVTRFMVTDRVLNLNVPLSLICRDRPPDLTSYYRAAYNGRRYAESVIIAQTD